MVCGGSREAWCGAVVTLCLVRHAKALRRSQWEQAERLRPLSPGGHRQAQRLVELLRDLPIDRILTSPELRCRQTLEPLAGHLALPIETEARLAADAPLADCLEALRELGSEDAVICTQGDRVLDLLEKLCAGCTEVEEEPPCEKGSVWVVEGSLKAPESAIHLPAPTTAREGAGVMRPVGDALEGLPGEKTRIAVVDLGSTSFHLVVADANATGEMRRVLRQRSMLRLGAVMGRRGRIGDGARKRAVRTAEALRHHCERARADVILPVATSALREAQDGAKLAERIGRALGTPVRVLSGVEEARLIFAAFRHRLALGGGTSLGLDLGGGSLELAVGDASDVHFEATLPLGVARLHAELSGSDPLAKAEVRAVRSRVRELLEPYRGEIADSRPVRVVATGGTVGALARLIATRRTSWPTRSVAQLFVPLAELRELMRELVRSDHPQRVRMPGIQRQRADLLPIGSVVLEAVASQLGLEGFVVSDWGLREGVILERLGLARLGPGSSPEPTSRAG